MLLGLLGPARLQVQLRGRRRLQGPERGQPEPRERRRPERGQPVPRERRRPEPLELGWEPQPEPLELGWERGPERQPEPLEPVGVLQEQHWAARMQAGW